MQKESGKTFVNIDENNYWFDDVWKDLSLEKPAVISGVEIDGADSTLKVFTVNELKDNTLKEIKVTKEPDKIEYYKGEKFDKTGMVVTGYLNSGETIEIENYLILNGDDLSEDQKEVTIQYEDKTTTQPITIIKNTVESLSIKKQPDKTEYKAGESFDSKGMILEAIFRDDTVEEVTDFEVLDGADLKNGQDTVHVKYEDITIEVPITVIENKVVALKIVSEPQKLEYIEGQDFNKSGMVVKAIYEDGTEKEITSYSVENGVKLTSGQTSVIIKFEDQTVEQKLLLKENLLLIYQ